MRPVLLVDFGGVLVHSTNPSVLEEWQRRLGVNADSVIGAIFHNAMSFSAMVGKIPADALFPELAAELAISAPQAHDLWETFWRSQGPNEPLIEYLESLTPRVDLAVCSNFWPNYEEIMLRRYKLERMTTRFFISSSLECTKPSESFFKMVREKCAPRDRLGLVDDLAANISGAEQSSIHGIHHFSTAVTIERIERWLSSV